jgi:hypothetical protein
VSIGRRSSRSTALAAARPKDGPPAMASSSSPSRSAVSAGHPTQDLFTRAPTPPGSLMDLLCSMRSLLMVLRLSTPSRLPHRLAGMASKAPDPRGLDSAGISSPGNSHSRERAARSRSFLPPPSVSSSATAADACYSRRSSMQYRWIAPSSRAGLWVCLGLAALRSRGRLFRGRRDARSVLAQPAR